ncbi:MAG TPA: hypothetical protein VNL77_01510 [Roseiflexaceae bacterium]|nr:hypothetical protein [Roseiflexaceae bacterium]
MILVRDVFQARYGKGGELVALFKEARQRWPAAARYGQRILTDASGPFFTVVTETEVENLAAWEQLLSEVFANPDFGAWFGRMEPLVESGRREFYNIET